MSDTNRDIFPAKVVKVVDRYQLVINRGTDDGIEVDRKFMIYTVDEEELKDPDTGESLGKLEIVKGVGIVIHAQPKISTIESSKKETGGTKKIIRTGGGALTNIFGQQVHEEIIDPTDRIIPFNDPEVGDLIKPI